MQIEAADAFDIAREPQHDPRAVRRRRAWPADADRPAAAGARRPLSCSSGTARASRGTTTTTSKRTTASSPARSTSPSPPCSPTSSSAGCSTTRWSSGAANSAARPPSNWAATASRKLGRDHNHYGFSVWLAGGGVKGGTVYGATDEFGFKAVENPASVHDLHATILHLLGFDHERLTYRYAGRDFRLTDVSGDVIREIIV